MYKVDTAQWQSPQIQVQGFTLLRDVLKVGSGYWEWNPLTLGQETEHLGHYTIYDGDIDDSHYRQ